MSPHDQGAKKRATNAAKIDEKEQDPIHVQGVTMNADFKEQLVLVIEMPGHIKTQQQVDVTLPEPGTHLVVTRPRGDSTSNIQKVEKAMVNMATLHHNTVFAFRQVLEKTMMEMRGNMTEMVFSTHMIPLLKKADTNKSPSFGLFRCADGSAGLVVVLDIPSKDDYATSNGAAWDDIVNVD